VRIAKTPEEIHAVRIAAGEADAVIGCDLVVAASPDALAKMRDGQTKALINTHEIMTAGFIRHRDMPFPTEALKDIVGETVGAANLEVVEATQLATALMGDSIATNMFMLGYAFQKGLVPLELTSIEKAVELNGVAVRANKEAFTWGRKAAVDLEAVRRIAFPEAPVELDAHRPQSLDEIVERRVRDLTDYQNAAYAKRYEVFVRNVARVEQEKAKGKTGLAEAVARTYYKLMAYKDEYEVARLYTSREFTDGLKQTFEGHYKLKVHLAPPLLARRDPDTGELQKMTFGSWILTAFRILKRFKFLRGTRLDPFGRTEERKMERALIGKYEDAVKAILDKLNAGNHQAAVELARLPEDIRGFGHIKEASAKAVVAHWERLLADFGKPPSASGSGARAAE